MFKVVSKDILAKDLGDTPARYGIEIGSECEVVGQAEGGCDGMKRTKDRGAVGLANGRECETAGRAGVGFAHISRL